MYTFVASNANKIFNITYVTVLGTQRNDKSFQEKNKEEKLLVKHRKKNVLSIVLQSFATSISCTVLLLVKLSNMYYSAHFPTDVEYIYQCILSSVPLILHHYTYVSNLSVSLVNFLISHLFKFHLKLIVFLTNSIRNCFRSINLVGLLHYN